MQTAAAAQAGRAPQLGRFQLLRELGRGAQARVWLAHDPRLDREVALKLLDPAADAAAVSEWLHEARAVSRLTHPNVVPVFEADEHRGQPYLVFEYVDGPTLAQARRGQPPMPPRAAVELMLGVLDALAAAHDEGLVHRDLKPSNILLGSDGRARVMDFGIAARTAHGRKGPKPNAVDGRIAGTPGYMSPEAARGEAPLPAMDVFAAGAVLGELLAGAPLLRETDPLRAVQRVQHEDLAIPDEARIDPTLRAIVQRALSRQLATRHDSARALHAALAAWLNPPEAALPDAAQSHATLEFLLRRMRHKTDFPALSSAVVNIQRLAASDTESQRSLCAEILKDVALTHKLLRMVNTAHFSAVAGGGVATVSRAVALVGFAGIRNMALSVVLLEHMGDKAHAVQLKEEFLRALMAGTLAEELSPLARESEEAFLGAMFQNLGRLLTECYFPEEAVQIRQRLTVPEADPTATPAREAAARRVLGIGFDDLGAGVARAWGLPETLQRSLRPPEGEPPRREPERGPERAVERLRWLGRSANALADSLLAGDGDTQATALEAAAALYAPVLGLSTADVVAAVHTSRSRVRQLAQAMGLTVIAPSRAGRLLQGTLQAPLPPAAAARTAARTAADRTLVLEPPGSPAHDRLSQGLEDVRRAVAAKTLRVNEVLYAVLDTLHRALEFHCVVFCLREAGGGPLVGRVGLGPGGSELSLAFRFKPDPNAVGDLFAWLCAKGADLLVSDARSVAGRLPAWYRQRVDAPTFVLLPLMLKGQPLGLIYADKAKAGSIVLGEQDLVQMRALRDQLALAFARPAAG